jgi:hypothetical protein
MYSNMELLHPAAQVTTIIVIGICACVFFLSTLTDFFDNFNRKK